MYNIVVNAPIQNKAFSPDMSPGKVVPLLVAEWLRTSDESFMNQEYPVGLWNNVLATEQNGLDVASYNLQMRERLEDKYASELLDELHRGNSNQRVLTDTDKDFTDWAKTRIERALEHGDLRVKDLGVFVCRACDATLAVSDGPQPQGCTTCNDATAIATINRETLTASITAQTDRLVDEATHIARSGSSIYGDFVVNKRRVNGISLERYGFKGDVVDPRIGLGLLAMYAAVEQGAGGVDIIASRTTARQNLSQFYAATASQTDELPRLRVRGIAKAPVNYLLYLRDEGVLDNTAMADVLQHKLSASLLAMRRDMSPQCAERLIFSRRTQPLAHSVF